MLVLKRSVQEAVLINGDEIMVLVDKIQGNRVQLVVTFPPGCLVFRHELYTRLRETGAKLKPSRGKCLVVARKLNESIVFPDLRVRVSINIVRRSEVSIGIEAPMHIKVLRAELNEQKPEDKEGACA